MKKKAASRIKAEQNTEEQVASVENAEEICHQAIVETSMKISRMIMKHHVQTEKK